MNLSQWIAGLFSRPPQQATRILTDGFGRPLRRVDGDHVRSDAWVNGMTGLGTSHDKSNAARYEPVRRISDAECTNLMNGSALAAKIVEKRPKEMFRRGYALECAKPKGEKGKAGKKAEADVDKSEADELHDFANERFRIDEEFPKAQIYANLYGGGVLLMGADDGGMQDEELDEKKIRDFRYVNFVDRRFVYVQAYYNDPLAPNYGRPSHYLLSNGVSGGGYKALSNTPKGRSNKVLGHVAQEGYGTTVVHESRLIRFEGVGADQITMQSLAGWTWSILQRVYDDMKKYETAFDAVRYLMQDASQAVFMLEGLISQISAGQSNNIRRRIQVLEETRSVMHGIILDAKTEKFERSPTTFGGLGELLDKMMLTLSAAVDIPVTELFGRAPGGLNSTTGGDAEQTKWYDSIASLQKLEMAPRLKRFYRLLSLSSDCPIGRKDVKWEIKFHPLREPTDDEMAKRDLTLAQKDQIYISEGVVSPEEVALERQDQYASMDVEAREEAAKGALTFDPHENDPEQIPDPGEIPSPTVPLPVAADPRNPTKQAPLGQTAAPAGGNTGRKPGGGGGGAGGSKPAASPAAATTKKPAAEPATKKTAAPAKPKKDAADPEPPPASTTVSARYDSAAIADAVYNQLAEDYPPEAIAWVKAAKWKGPGRVALERVDYSGAASWQASHDPIHVDVHKKRITDGIEKPIILVKVPHSKKFIIADGHHRGLAYKKIGQNPRAYIATVDSSTGPWDSMHDEQGHEGLIGSMQKDSAPPSGRGDGEREDDWDESKHPRVPAGGPGGGQFGEGGGGSSTSAPKASKASALAAAAGKVKPEPKAHGGSPIEPITGDKPIGDQLRGPRVWTDKLPEGMKEQSWQGHWDKAPWEGGKPSAERQRDVIDPIVKQALDVKPVPVGEQKRAIMTMGGPASGKSSALRGIDTTKYVKVDPDDIKTKLPEYQKAVADRDNTFRGAAGMAHEESSQIKEMILSKAIANGNHIVVDGTGSDAKSFVERMNMLQKAGYVVHVALPHLDVETGMHRMVVRADESGRMVPEKFARKAYETIPKNFERIVHQADSFQMYDNGGKSARLVWSGTKGQPDTHHDPEFVAGFKAKYKADSARSDDFNESQHPRDEHGRFGEGGGTGGTAQRLSRVAETSHLAKDHVAAAKMHREASAEAHEAGNRYAAEEHAAKAAEHEARAGTAKTEAPAAPIAISKAKPEAFHAAFTKAFEGSPFSSHVTHYTPEELKGMKLYMTADGKAGVAVHDHGDGRIEGTALFNQGGQKGAGIALLRHVVADAGVNYVEAYGPVLNQLYSKLGFQVTSRSAFNQEYAAKGWDYGRFDHPDYFTMKMPTAYDVAKANLV